MKEYVLDSSALLLYLRDARDASRVQDLFGDAEARKANLTISAVNWAECRHKLTRQKSAQHADGVLSEIANALEVVVADRSHAELAGDLKCRFKGSLADCFAATLAMHRNATLVTTDPEFDALRRELKILRLEKLGPSQNVR